MFEKVVIITRDGLSETPAVQAFLVDLTDLLSRNSVKLYINVLPEQTSLRTLFIAIGGDGTMLQAAKQSASYDALVIGFNMGRLGFLVENEFVYSDSYHRSNDTFLSTIRSLVFDQTIDLKGKTEDEIYRPYFIEDRMMIEGEVLGEQVGPALNEILLSPNTLAAPFEYNIYINNKFVAHHNSSGILVSTPTGSTAFSLSLGGSILLPTARVMQIIPVAAHTLTARPIVVGEQDAVQIEVAPTTRISNVDIIADGRVVKSISTNTFFVLNVSSAGKTVRIIHQKSWNFFDVLTQKLGWK